ncbi:MAG: hypothetical protein IJT88_02430 [Kiritimatiellae bacterium]|nr:hypothetical protein [Kiritimatiellia bacterium]
MLNPLHSLSPLARAVGQAGRLSRLEATLDRLVRFCAGLRGGRGISVDFTARGEPVVSYTGNGGGGGFANYGFRVWVDSAGKVQVAAGTAQVWGGAVTAYAATTNNGLGAAVNGHFVYAVCDLTVSPPEWYTPLEYDDMDQQPAGDQLWIPIAQTTGSSQAGWTVTQLHWGNIVVPALANVVDVQSTASS